MDREIPKSERQKVSYRRLGRVAVAVFAAIGVIIAVTVMMRTEVKRSEIIVVTADCGTVETSVTGTGRVIPAFEQIINSPIASRIVEVYRKEGDTLNVGTPLLRLDLQSAESEIKSMADERRSKFLETEQTRLDNHTTLSNLEMQVKVKEMDVNRLRSEVINERRLDSIGSGTGERVRQAEFAYETGRLNLEQLRQQLVNERKVRAAMVEMKNLELSIFDKNYNEKQRTLEDARLKSPRKATLTYINNQIGEQVSQGQRVAVIADLSHFKVTAEIADMYADRVTPGSKAVVKAGSTELSGTVTSVTPLSKNGIISFNVTLDDDDHQRLRSGLKTEVFVLSDIHDDVVRIPVGSFYKGPGDYKLFVVSGDELVKRQVMLGEASHKFIEVKSGVSAGESVVISDMNKYQQNNNIKLK